MCGRFSFFETREAIREAMAFATPDQIPIRYNIAPTQLVAVVPNDGKNTVDFFIWGLIPSWAKEAKIGNRLINARAETVAEKPSFRSAYKRRRCLVLANGFFEWTKPAGSKTKVPHYIQLASREAFGFAGLWEVWLEPDGSELKSCTIITTEPNEMIAKLHNRMPVILPREAYDLWLDPEEKSRQELDPLLKPYPAEEMRHHAVATLVNSPANEVPEVILPAD